MNPDFYEYDDCESLVESDAEPVELIGGTNSDMDSEPTEMTGDELEIVTNMGLAIKQPPSMTYNEDASWNVLPPDGYARSSDDIVWERNMLHGQSTDIRTIRMRNGPPVQPIKVKPFTGYKWRFEIEGFGIGEKLVSPAFPEQLAAFSAARQVLSSKGHNPLMTLAVPMCGAGDVRVVYSGDDGNIAIRAVHG